jgi:hypothetical protein
MIEYADALNLSTLIKCIDPTTTIGYLDVTYSDLGGKDRASLIVKGSLEHKEQWINGILHNAQYSMFRIDWNNSKNRYVIEQFSRNHLLSKFRKCSTAKTLADVAQKIVAYFEQQ